MHLSTRKKRMNHEETGLFRLPAGQLSRPQISMSITIELPYREPPQLVRPFDFSPHFFAAR